MAKFVDINIPDKSTKLSPNVVYPITFQFLIGTAPHIYGFPIICAFNVLDVMKPSEHEVIVCSHHRYYNNIMAKISCSKAAAHMVVIDNTYGCH